MATSETAERSEQAQRGDGAPRLRFTTWQVVVYGLVCAILAAAVLAARAPTPWPIQGSRQIELRASIDALHDGAPPLTGKLAPGVHPPPSAHIHRGLYPISVT